ncbi:MAG: hypothetical protein WC619_03375 [Patescibacteria group bacterium]
MRWFKNKILAVAVLFSLLSAIAGYWVFEVDWYFLPWPLTAGLFMVLAQDGKRSLDFIKKLLVGSLIYGGLSWFLILLRLWLGGAPFWKFSRPWEFLVFALIFVFVSFLGGLAGIVIKGFYFLLKKQDG